MSLIYEWAGKLLIIALIINHGRSVEVLNDKNKTAVIHKGIHKRGLFYPVLLYPYNACSGILAAIAIPLDVPQRNVFLSYNFEANYNMPNQPGESFPGMINRFPGLNVNTRIDPTQDTSPDDIVLRRSFEKSGNGTNSTSISSNLYDKAVNNIVVITRIGIYRVLESRLNA